MLLNFFSEFPREAGGGEDDSETEFDLGAVEDYDEEGDLSYQMGDSMADRAYENLPPTPLPRGNKLR